jgi:CRP-like cAMP-binding protein
MDEALKINVLTQHPFLPAEIWDVFFANAQYTALRKGQFLLKNGNTAKSFYLLVNGSVRMYEVTDKGEDITYDFIFENTFFTAYGSFFKQQPSETNMVLLEDGAVLSVAYSTFENVLCKLPGWQQFALRLVVENTMQLLEKEKMVMVGNPVLSYATLLGNRPLLFQRVEQRHIASYMGITPETLSRVKRKLHAAGGRFPKGA